ncbi:MAG TPA: tripartite tricarboxylate transporter substrate binding protein [Pseudolabrys sp.]
MKRAFWIGCGLLALLPAAARAQSDYPSRPVHLVVGFGAGSAADLTARVLGQRLSKTLGQPFLVEIKPGGGSTIAAEQVARSPKDGYTLFIGTVAVIINGLLQPNPRVNLANDFAPITLATSSPNILVVHPSTGVSNVKELIALAKSKPGQLNFGTSGFGTSPHLTGELFNLMADTKIVSVHYQGSAQALTDLLGGRIQVMFSPASTVLSQVEAGQIRALATSELTRTAAAPKLPTVAESGLPGFNTSLWFGVVAPAGTPRPIVDKLAGAINEALKNEEVTKPLIAAGLDIKGGTPDEFAAYIASETEKYNNVVTAGGLRTKGP